MSGRGLIEKIRRAAGLSGAAGEAGHGTSKGLMRLLAAYPDAAMVIDHTGRMRWINPAAAAFTGLTGGEAPGALVEAARAVIDRGDADRRNLVVRVGPTEKLFEFTTLPLGAGRAAVLGRDITLDRNLSSALVESRERYKDLVDLTSDFSWETGPDGRFVFVTSRGALGFRASELVGSDPAALIVGAPGDASPFQARDPIEDADVVMRRADGSEACLVAHAVPLIDARGAWLGARGICRDVTADRARDRALSRAHHRERAIAHLVQRVHDEIEPTAMLDAAARALVPGLGAQGVAIFRTPLLAPAPAAVAGLLPDAGVIAGVLADLRGGARDIDRDAENGTVMASLSSFDHAANGAVVAWYQDPAEPDEDSGTLLRQSADQLGMILAQVANKERLEVLSRTDALTGLLNRRAFYEETEKAIARARRTGSPAALCFVDLNNFKSVNDVLGHKAGDEALVVVADLLRRNSRAHDLVARLGGDEFALWLEATTEVGGRVKASQLEADRSLAERFPVAVGAPLGLAVGFAIFDPASGDTVADLADRADRAMYAAKRRLKKRVASGGGATDAATRQAG